MEDQIEIIEKWLQPPHESEEQQEGVSLSVPPAVQTAKSIQAWLTSQLAERLGIEPDTIDVREPFAHYELSSKEAVSLSGDAEEWLGRRLSPTLAYEYPTIERLAQHLAGEPGPAPFAPRVDNYEKTEREPIAIIGIGCRFPGASNPSAFWQLLQDGVDAIREVPPDRFDLSAFYNPNPAVPGKLNSRWGGFLEQVDQFDAVFLVLCRVRLPVWTPSKDCY